MAFNNRITGIHEDPSLPGYGRPSFEDGTTGHPAPMTALNEALKAQEEELRAQRGDQRLAMGGAGGDSSEVVGSGQAGGVSVPEQPKTVTDVPTQLMSMPEDAPTSATAQPMSMPPAVSKASMPPVSKELMSVPPAEAQPMSMPKDLPMSVAERLGTTKATRVEAPMTPQQAAIAQYAITPVRRPYRPAYDPEADAASRRAVPTGRVTETQAQPYDVEAEQKYEDTVRATAQVQEEANLENAQLALGQKRIAQDAQQQAIAMKEKQLADAQSFYDSEAARLQQEGQDIAARKVDQGRYFAGRSTFERLGWVIGAMLLGGAGSDAGLQLIQQRVETDVNDQLEALTSARGSHENELARLAQRWGSLEAAKDALAVQHYNAILAEADTQATAMGTAQAATNNKILHAKIEEQLAGRHANLRNQAIGTTVTREKAAMAAPRAASGGGARMRTPEEVLKYADKVWGVAQKQAGVEQTLASTEQTLASTEKTMTEAAALKSGGTPQQQQMIAQNVEHLGIALAQVANLQVSVDTFINDSGVTFDKRGRVVGDVDIPGFGMKQKAASVIATSLGLNGEEAAQMVSSHEGEMLRRQVQEVLTNKIKDASGSAFSEDEAARHAQSLALAVTKGPKATAQAVKQFQEKLNEKVARLRAAAGPEAAAIYDQNLALERQNVFNQTTGADFGAEPMR